MSKGDRKQKVVCVKRVQRTFARIVEETREDAAAAAWKRARTASQCRHVAIQQGHMETAELLSQIKRAALRRALEIAPESIVFGVDGDFQIGMTTVSWAGHGRMHLPRSWEDDLLPLGPQNVTTSFPAASVVGRVA